MEIFHSITYCKQQTNKTILTIGVFDGVHIGHQNLLKILLKKARIEKLKTIIITFDPTPKEYFNTISHSSKLTSTHEKIKKLEKMGVDCLIIQPFDKKISFIKSDDFIKVHLSHLNISWLVVGFNNNIGNKKNQPTIFSLEIQYPY